MDKAWDSTICYPGISRHSRLAPCDRRVSQSHTQHVGGQLQLLLRRGEGEGAEEAGCVGRQKRKPIVHLLHQLPLLTKMNRREEDG
jgi:hypothetical protein